MAVDDNYREVMRKSGKEVTNSVTTEETTVLKFMITLELTI